MGGFLQAHVGNLANCPVADFRKSANQGGFLQAQVGNLGNCPVADFKKPANWGGEFLQAHISKCPVADLRKSANWGGNSAYSNKKIKFSKSVFIFYL